MNGRFNDIELGADADEELDINNPSQLQYWMEHWEVSERDLRMAVATLTP